MIPERFRSYYEPVTYRERREALVDLRTRRFLACREHWAIVVGCVLWIVFGLGMFLILRMWFFLVVAGIGVYGLYLIGDGVEQEVGLALATEELERESERKRTERARVLSLLTVVAAHPGHTAIDLAELGLPAAGLAELSEADLIVYRGSPPAGWYLTGAADLFLADEREDAFWIESESSGL